MAEDLNVHAKVAMADVFGCLLVGWVAFFVAAFGFKIIPGAGGFINVLFATGIGCAIVTYFMFKNENILGTAIFGPLCVSFIAYALAAWGVFGLAPLGNELGLLIGFVGLILLIDAILSLFQPVKMLSVVLFIAAIAYFILGYTLSVLYTQTPSQATVDSLLMMIGIFFALLCITATYLGTAVCAFVMKGKPILPLLIMAPKK
ncbi:MAG: hypothetical protein WCK39_07385 [Methanomassiliicoccales archaeon]